MASSWVASAPAEPDHRPPARISRPTATVLIPAHNEATTVAELVRACRAQPYPLDAIVVVADSCTDDTAQAALRAGATKVIEVDFKDKASAQNAALFEISTDVVVGFDGDTIPQPDCIELMIRDIEDGFDATCATVLPIQPRGFFIRARRFAYALGRRWWRLCQAKVGRIQVLTGAAYVFKTEAIKSIGGFPGGLISADMDATWALHRARYKLGYAGDAVALTYDPETFRVYKQQMRRWSSGYFQNMAKYRRELLHWRAILVVWTALFDLCCLFVYETALAITLVTGHDRLAGTFALWLAIHAIVTTSLVATVVGVREAVLGYFPYLIVNYYNKWLYLCAFVREWILGRHYVSWTGRQGRKTEITKMTRARKLALTSFAAVSIGAVCFGAIALGWNGVRQTVRQTVLPSRPAPVRPVTVTAATRFAGVVAYNLPQFDQACGCRPDLAVRDVGVGSPIDNVPAQTMIANGAVPLIELEPYGVSLREIIDGKEDKWLASQAKGDRRAARIGADVVRSRGQRQVVHLGLQPRRAGRVRRRVAARGPPVPRRPAGQVGLDGQQAVQGQRAATRAMARAPVRRHRRDRRLFRPRLPDVQVAVRADDQGHSPAGEGSGAAHRGVGAACRRRRRAAWPSSWPAPLGTTRSASSGSTSTRRTRTRPGRPASTGGWKPARAPWRASATSRRPPESLSDPRPSNPIGVTTFAQTPGGRPSDLTPGVPERHRCDLGGPGWGRAAPPV